MNEQEIYRWPCMHLPYCTESCLCPRLSATAQDTSAWGRTTNSLPSLLEHNFCHSCQIQPWDPSPGPMMILNGSNMFYASMYTLRLQPCLQAQVLHVLMLYSDSQEDGPVRICLRCTYTGKLNHLDMLFHSVVKKICRKNHVRIRKFVITETKLSEKVLTTLNCFIELMFLLHKMNMSGTNLKYHKQTT